MGKFNKTYHHSKMYDVPELYTSGWYYQKIKRQRKKSQIANTFAYVLGIPNYKLLMSAMQP